MSGRLLGLIPAPLSLTVATTSTALSNIIGYTDVILVQPVENMFCVIENVSCWLTYLREIWSWSQWLNVLRHWSTATRFLGLRVKIPLGAQMSVCYEYCGLSSRGLCDGLRTRPEESYRVWRVELDVKVKPQQWRGLGPLGVVKPGKKKNPDTATRLHLFWPNNKRRNDRNVTNNRFYPTYHKTNWKQNAKIVGYRFERSKHGIDILHMWTRFK